MNPPHQAHAQAPGPALVRLLAQLAEGEGPPAPPGALADRLSQWIDWPQAVALSSSLDTRATHPAQAAPAAGDYDDCDAVRGGLLRTIEGDRAFVAAAVEPGAGFYRQRYGLLQQVMGAEVDLLRRRLRQRLVQVGGEVARLAAVDAVFDKAVGGRERALLSALPALVAAHHERLAAAESPPVSGWRAMFQRDMKRLLVTELDVRLQPARGLLAALRPRTDAHAQ